MRKILFLLLFFPLLSQSQENKNKYYDVAEIPIKPKGVFRIDPLSYSIVDVVDLQNNNSILGEIYYGMLNHFALLHVKDGISENFIKYFHKSLKYVEKGDRKIVIAFRKYSMNEKKENLNLRGGRLRNYEIEVDYYESKEDSMVYLYTDRQKVDSLSNLTHYNINKFTDAFFKSSLPGLDRFLRNMSDTVVEAGEKEEKFNIVSKNNPNAINSSYDSSLSKLSNDYVKVEPKGLPKVHMGMGFETFQGNTANGLRFRFFSFQREWDSLHWVGMFSLDIEGTTLNRSFGNDANIYTVEYSYFALGVGAVKPLNNYFFLELSGKLAIGNETIYRDAFYSSFRKNSLFGPQLNQRLHFMLGKGIGLMFSAGVYETFYFTTDYLKSDFGYSLGGAIKF